MIQLTVLCEITIDGKDVQQSGQAQVIFGFKNLNTDQLELTGSEFLYSSTLS